MIFVDNIEFENEFRPEATKWLLGNVQERIVATIDISIREVAIPPSASAFFEFFPSIGFLNASEIIKAKTPVFTNFNTGDEIKILNSGANNRASATIVEKIDDFTLRTGETFTNATSSSATIVLSDTVDGFNFRYGLIENDEAFNTLSKIDGSDQLFYAPSIDATDLVTVNTMVAGGLKSWQNGSATIVGLGTDTYNQKFRIVHTFDIIPSYIDGEIDNLRAGISPEFFTGTKCLKYATDFEGLFDISDPNRKHTGQYYSIKGNTGWYNENFNNKPAKYSLEGLKYTKPDLTVVESIRNSVDATDVEIKLKASVPAFSNNNTKFLLCFEVQPTEDEYLNGERTIKENFLFDRVLQTVGSASIDGDNDGTDQQVLQGVTATFVDSKNITINFSTLFNQVGILFLRNLTEGNYTLSVIIQDHTLTSILSDKVNILCDVNTIVLDLTDDGMITIDAEFIEHDDVNLVGTLAPETFSGDEVILRNIIRYNTEGRDKDKVTFSKAIIKIIAENSTDLKSFELEKYEYDFTNDVKVDGVLQVDVIQEREFIMDALDNRKLIKVKRRVDLDEAGVEPPTNLITNGNFDLDLSGWVPSSSFIWANGVASVRDTGGKVIQGAMFQTFTTVASSIYTVSFDLPKIDSSFPAKCYVTILDTNVSGAIVRQALLGKAGSFTLDFTALSATTVLFFSYKWTSFLEIDNVKVALFGEVTPSEVNKFFYEISYPFLVRWEYWEALVLANAAFFNTSSPQNGLNNLWQHYQSGTWSVKAVIQLIINNDNFIQTYENKLSLPQNNYSSNSAWTNEYLKSFDGATELISGADRLYFDYKDVRVEAFFEKTIPFVTADITVVIWAEIKEAGGITGRTRISSKYNVDGGSWFKSVDNSNKVKLTIVGNTVKAEALLEYTRLPQADTLRIYARIYENSYTGNFRLLESGDFRLLEDGNKRLLEG